MQLPSVDAGWEQSIVKIIAGGGLSMVSFSFAAFTFLYATLLGLRSEHTERFTLLKTRLRRALYATALAGILSTIVTALAFTSLVTGHRLLALVTIGFAAVLTLVLSGISIYLAYDVFAEG